MYEVADANDRLRAVLRMVAERLPREEFAQVLACWETGDPVITFDRLCTALAETNAVLPYGRYRHLCHVGELLGLPPARWAHVRFYLAENA